MDTSALVDPVTYEAGPPFATLRRLREAGPLTWVEEPALHGLAEGPGFWLVCGTPRSSGCCATRPRSRPGWARRRSATPRTSSGSAG